ncbi:MAG: zf-HC2 domain-containing protein [Gemmatimonadales bacterium]|nr:zf-HC2 domain-containing protein [Gemmatimonadales bacterium]
MRHIPEDELHAYLDQGLSRSQCVEIESHLAGCASCQGMRDNIAALRDRTTALLARLAPPRSFPTPFDTIRRRAAIEVSARRRRVHRAAWAASVVAAVAFGWTASQIADSSGAFRTATGSPAAAPLAASLPVTPVAAVSPAPTLARPARGESNGRRTTRRPLVRKVAAAEAPRVSVPPVIAPAELELSTIDIPAAGDFELDGMWRTMSWVGAQAETGNQLPHIDGLPVVQVQVQAGKQGKQPLMVVAQQLVSGEVIRTIEGPASDVSHLLARRTMSDPDPKVSSTDSTRPGTVVYQGVDGSMAMQRGDRMIAITGALPPDSLLAMIRRLNAALRSK